MKNDRLSPSTRRRNQKGHAMMEAALTSTLFLALLIGTFDFGQFLFLHQALVERARLAARWGAVTGNGIDLLGTKNEPVSVQHVVAVSGGQLPGQADSGFRSSRNAELNALNV